MGVPAPRGKVKLAYDLREENPDMSTKVIARELGVARSAVAGWFKEPETFDPFYDRVAIQRALKGDGEVFANLTVYERRLVVGLLERSETPEEAASERFPLQYAERVSKAVNRRRRAVDGVARPSHHRIATTKLTPDVRQRVKKMRQGGIDFEVIAEVLDLSRSSVFRALRNAS